MRPLSSLITEKRKVNFEMRMDSHETQLHLAGAPFVKLPNQARGYLAFGVLHGFPNPFVSMQQFVQPDSNTVEIDNIRKFVSRETIVEETLMEM